MTDWPRRVLVLPDLHVPFQDTRALRAVLDYAEDEDWWQVILLGDILDHNSISHFNVNNLRAVEGQSLAKDYVAGNAVLDQIEKATPGAHRVAIEGNHDYRPEVFVNRCPQLAGSIETPLQLRLKQRGWQWVPFWSKGDLYRIGNAYFMHGRKTNKYHAESNVTDYGVPIFYGHTHDVMEIPRVLQGKDKTLVGASLGCLCRYDLPWLHGRPTKWQHAVGTFWFQKNGNFNYCVSKIFNGRFVAPNGKVYGK